MEFWADEVEALGVSFGASWDSNWVRFDAHACWYKSLAKSQANNHIASECDCVQNRAEGIRADYESAALTAELQARVYRHILH
jgi:hypothetical protein